MKIKFNISIQYFVYFFTLGVFLPYFNLYCHSIGFSSIEIGIISSLKTFSVIIFPILWGIVADRFAARKRIFIIANFGASFFWGFFFFSKDFYIMLLIMLFYSVFHAPIISFLEAFTMDILGKTRNKYGKVRLWGSMGFIISVFIIGYLMEILGADIVIIVIFVGTVVHFLLSLSMSDFSSEIRQRNSFNGFFFINKNLVLFLAASVLMLMSHGPYYSFFSIYLSDQGAAHSFIGFAWGVAVVAELIVMYNSSFIFRFFSPKKVLCFSMLAACFRWVILYFVTLKWAILLSQVLHCFTYASFHIASIIYMDTISPKDKKTTGQAINNSLTYGFGLMIGNFLSGYFYDYYGGQVLFLYAGGCVFIGYILMLFTQDLKKDA